MLKQNRQTIELGGHGVGQSHSFVSLDSAILSRSSQSVKFSSRQAMISPHKISSKISPNKQQLLPKKLLRQISNLQNSTNTFQIQNSETSLLARLGERALFQERNNIISAASKGIVINYSAGVTPGHSRNSSINHKEAVSPNKIDEFPQRPQCELQLERKLKILEARIGQLHRQKQQSAAKLNQQNRKLYHENVSLKQKVNELAKALQKVHKVEILASERSQASSSESYLLEQSHLQFENLRKEIDKLQQRLATQVKIQNQLAIQNQALSANLSKATSICQNLEQEMKKLKDLLATKSAALQQVTNDFQILKQHFQQIKIAQDNQIQNIRQSTFQNDQRQQLILKEYQSKIDEYQLAYNSNQQLIHQLEQQLKSYQNVARSVIKQENIQESFVHTQLANQCQELQNNLLATIQEKDALIEGLNYLKDQLQHEIYQKQLKLKQILQEDDGKTKKLEQASQLLNKVTLEFQELSQKYRQITQKYEEQKINFVKTKVPTQKCKKCDQLLKTVLRLNSHLNLKK